MTVFTEDMRARMPDLPVASAVLVERPTEPGIKAIWSAERKIIDYLARQGQAVRKHIASLHVDSAPADLKPMPFRQTFRAKVKFKFIGRLGPLPIDPNEER